MCVWDSIHIRWGSALTSVINSDSNVPLRSDSLCQQALPGLAAPVDFLLLASVQLKHSFRCWYSKSWEKAGNNEVGPSTQLVLVCCCNFTEAAEEQEQLFCICQ